MPNKLLKVTAAAALAAGMMFAQSQPAPVPAPGDGTGQHHGMRAHRMARMAEYLNLTDAQKEQAKTIFGESRQSAQPVMQQLKQNRQALRDAVKSGKSEAEIDQLASSQGPLLAQLVGIRTKAFAKFYAGLTPEQRQKADQMHDQFKNRFQNRMRGRADG